MARHDIKIPKKEVTRLKIELAGAAIRAENDRRKEYNKSLTARIRKSSPLPMIRPSFVHTTRKPNFGDARNAGPIKGMDTIVLSNKYLCGKLSVLCDVMRENGIKYPWKEDKR